MMNDHLTSVAVALALAARAPAPKPSKPTPSLKNVKPAPGVEAVPHVATLRLVPAVGASLKPFVVARRQGGAYLAWARRMGEATAVFFSSSRDGARYSSPLRLSLAEMRLDLGWKAARTSPPTERGMSMSSGRRVRSRSRAPTPGAATAGMVVHRGRAV